MRKRFNIAVCIFGLMLLTFMGSNIAIGILIYYEFDDNLLFNVKKIMGIFNMVAYWPSNILKIYITWYFWKLGIKYANILRLSSNFSVKKVKIILAVVSLYQII